MANPVPEQTKNKPAQPPASNGNKPAEAAKPADGAEPVKTGEEEEKASRGVIPQMPTCVVWQEDNGTGAVVANLIHPRTEKIFAVRGKGIHGTTGTLGDEGYPLGSLRVEGPKWVLKFIPEGVKVLGYAPVLGFPLPTHTP